MFKKSIFQFILLFSLISNGQDLVPKPNYDLATRFSTKNVAKMVHSTSVYPRWLKKGNRFWYQYKTTDGSKYYMVDADKRTRKELFDNDKMAAWVTEITKDPYDGQNLPKFNFKFSDDGKSFQFRVKSQEMVESEDDSTKKEKKEYLFEYKIGGNYLEVISNKKKKEEKWKKWANISPDSTIVVFSKKYNINWMDKENFLKAVKDENDSTIVENKWTEDGEKHFDYGTGSRWDSGEDDETDRKRVNILWSHNSESFVYKKVDNRHIEDLWVLNSLGKRPKLETYKYHMAGEQEYPKSSLLVFDVKSKDINQISLDTTQQKDIYLFNHQLKKSEMSNDFKPSMILSKKGDIYFQVISRDKKKLDTYVAKKGNYTPELLITEETNTYHDIYNRKQIKTNVSGH